MRARREIAAGAGSWQRQPGVAPVVTFDVFDTLITRAVARPNDVFLLLGQRLAADELLQGHSAQAFTEARVLADRRAHANAGGREAGVDLLAIWRELCSSLSLPLEGLDGYVASELTIEADVLRPVAPTVSRFEQARRSSKVALISDTYLTRCQVHDLLTGCGIDVTPEEVFTSSDARAVKGTGKLFQVVAHQLGVSPEDLLHHGADQQADIVGARKVGAQAIRVELARNTRYETLLAQHGASTDGLSSLLAGASRMARIRMDDTVTRNTPIIEVAAGVAATVLLSYALWLLQRARQEGLERLYFLSRDGQVIREICRRIGPPLGWSDDQLRYLCVSRASVAAPMMLGDTRLSPWVWTHLESASAYDVLARVGCNAGAVQDEFRRLGITDPAAPLDGGRRAALQRSLESGPGSLALSDQLSQQRDLLFRYLEQEGFLDDTPLGVVDLGGRGSQFQALAAARDTVGLPAPVGFYGYLISPPGPPLHPDREHAWLFDERQGLGFARFPGLVSMLEAFCAADHGSVQGYVEAGGRAEPHFAPSGPRTKWGQGAMRDAVLHAADELASNLRLADIGSDARPAVMDVARLFWLDPTPCEVRAWAHFPVEEGRGSEPIARPASVREAAAFVSGRGWPGAWWEWPAACIELGPRRTRVWRRLEDRRDRGRLSRGLSSRGRRLLNRIAELR